jgi:hypothetical protein
VTIRLGRSERFTTSCRASFHQVSSAKLRQHVLTPAVVKPVTNAFWDLRGNGSVLDEINRIDRDKAERTRAVQPGEAGSSTDQPIDLTDEPSPPPPSRVLALSFPPLQPTPSPVTSLFDEGSLRPHAQSSLVPSTPGPSRRVDKRPDVSFTPQPRTRDWNPTSLDSPFPSNKSATSSSSSSSHRRRSYIYGIKPGSSNYRQRQNHIALFERIASVPGMSAEKTAQLAITMGKGDVAQSLVKKKPSFTGDIGLGHRKYLGFKECGD